MFVSIKRFSNNKNAPQRVLGSHSFRLRTGPAISLQGCSSPGGSPQTRPVVRSGLVFLRRSSRAEPWPYEGPPPRPAAEDRGTPGSKIRILCLWDLCLQNSRLWKWPWYDQSFGSTFHVFKPEFWTRGSPERAFWTRFPFSAAPFALSSAAVAVLELLSGFSSPWSPGLSPAALYKNTLLITTCLWVGLLFSPTLQPFIRVFPRISVENCKRKQTTEAEARRTLMREQPKVLKRSNRTRVWKRKVVLWSVLWL